MSIHDPPRRRCLRRSAPSPIRRGAPCWISCAGERSATELRLALAPGISGASQAAFSEHLSVLSRAGLVSARPQGRERIYSLNARPLAEAFDWLKPYEAFWDERLARLGDYLDRKARPQ